MNNVEQNQSLINDVVVQNGLATGFLFNNIATGEIIPKHIIITTRQQYGFLDDSVIYCNFNQLKKIDPTTFQVWINVSKSIKCSCNYFFKFMVIFILLFIILDLESCTKFCIMAVEIPIIW